MWTFTEFVGRALRSRRVPALVLASTGLVLTAEHCDQHAEIEWIRQFGGTGPTADFARKVAVDGEGNAYVVGVMGPLPGQGTAGELDAFLRKTDPEGFELWTTFIGTTVADDAFGVAVEDSGLVDGTGAPVWDVYVAGVTNGVFPGESSVGSLDFWAAKFREGNVGGGQVGGVVQWLTQFGTSASDNFASGSVAVDATSVDAADRGLYVGGVSSAGPGNPTLCTTSGALGLCTSGSGDAVVYKLSLEDGSLDPVFPISFGSTGSDFANAIVVYPSDDPAVAPTVYVAGQSGGALRGVRRAGGVIEPVTTTPVGGNDSFLIAFDGDGNLLKTSGGAARAIGFGSAGVDTVNGMVANDSGELILTGRVDLKGFVAAFGDDFGPGGGPLWQDVFGVPPQAGGTAPAGVTLGLWLALGASDRVYVVGGAANGVIAANGGIPGAIVQPGATLGLNDAFIRVLDGGVPVLTRQFGTPSGEQAAGVAVGPSTVHLCGNSQGAMPGGPGTLGGQDGWTRTWDPDLGSIAVSAYEVTDQFGGQGAVLDAILGVASDWRGNVISVGFTAGSVAQVGAGLDDLVVEKRSAAGNLLWTRQIGTVLADQATDVAIDLRGAIYVAGFTAGTLPGLVPGSAPGGGQDSIVMKFDEGGNLLWTRQWGTPAVDIANGIAVDLLGRVYVTGVSNNDVFLTRLGSDGSLAWETLLATAATDAGAAVAVDGSSVWVAGTVGAIVPGALTSPAETLGNVDGFVARYTSSGVRNLLVTFGTPSVDLVGGVAVNPYGVYVAGATPVVLPGQEGSIYLRSYGRDGLERWTRSFASFGAGNTADGLVALAGSIYLTGGILGALPDQVAVGFVDVFAKKYLADGSEVWATQFGTTASDGARDVTLTGTKVVLGGTTPGAMPGQPTFGAGDAWVALLDQVIVDDD